MPIHWPSRDPGGPSLLRVVSLAGSLVFALALTALLGWPLAARAQPWVRYDALFFTADFPSNPESSYAGETGASDPFSEYYRYKAESPSGNASYMVSVAAIKPETKAAHSSEDIIFMYIRRMQEVVRCDYIISTAQSDNVVGRESLSHDCDFGIWSKARYYVVRDRLTIIIVTSKGPEPMADVNRFLDSLHMMR